MAGELIAKARSGRALIGDPYSATPYQPRPILRERRASATSTYRRSGSFAIRHAARGCEVVGVEPDEPMADPFDVVVSAQAWHWVDQDIGPTTAADARARGCARRARGRVPAAADQGFIHCSFREQVQQIADLIYRGRSDVLLLEIDPSRLAATVKVEPPNGGRNSYPHIYGPLNRDAVVKVTPVDVREEGRLDIASAL